MTDAHIQTVESKLDDFRVEVRKRMDTVGDELRELTKALRELIRIDGDIRRIQDAVGRIGRQVDDHEERTRALETAGSAHAVTVKHLSAGQALVLAAGSSMLTGLIIFLLTH